ncbi:MAG: hypothetical protein AAF351_04295 [Pseudomonadota bacterium]
MAIIVASLGLLVFVAVLYFMLRGSSGSAQEDELFRLCRGDHDMMERLVALEIERGDDKRRSAAVRAAIRSLKRDS